MSIEGVNNALIIQKLKGIENTNSTASNESASPQADQVDISRDARLAQTLNRVRKAIEDAPEVREDRVAEARARLENGELDSPEVFDQVAEQLTRVMMGEDRSGF